MGDRANDGEDGEVEGMIPIKIQCGCGQRYAFDIDPVDGHMPGSVACPACGADGTGAANSIIRHSLAAHQPVAPIPKARVRVRAAAPPQSAAPPSSSANLHSAMARATAPGAKQVDRDQVEVEARAKIFWGEPRKEVIKYLMVNGYDASEANAMVLAMHKERASAIRGKGFRKIMIGCGMICVPLTAYLGMAHAGYVSLKLLGLAGAVGLWGLWMAFDGLVMFLSPKSEKGDVADK